MKDIQQNLLSGFNPIFEVEHYIDGQHNGGVFNSFNHNTYGYTYQNPVVYIDPNGKQAKITEGATQSLMVYAGYDFAKSSIVRMSYYKPKVEALYQSHYLKNLHKNGSILRTKAIIDSRKKLPPIGEAYSEMKKPTSSLKSNPQGRYYHVNAGEVRNAKIAGGAGALLLTYGAYQSYENIKSEGYTTESIGKEAFSWSGALIGGEIGGKSGATLGTEVGGVKGGLIGAIGGAAVGSVIGGFIGERAANETFGVIDYGTSINLDQAKFNVNNSTRTSVCNDNKCLR